MPQTESSHEQNARISIDGVIFTIKDNKLYVLLKKREKEPFKDAFELFGGIVFENETAEEGLVRKLNELLPNKKLFFTQFHTFTNPKRDPRQRTISIGFLTLINEENAKNLQEWHSCTELPKLAFDHAEIIQRAKDHLKKNISKSITKQLLPDKFPLNKLQETYELIEEKKYDNRNFRKRILSSELIKETKKREKDVSHRPAKLYMFTNKI